MDSEEQDYLQGLLIKERQRNELLLEKLEEAHDEIDRSHRQIQSLMRQTKPLDTLENDLEGLQQQLEAKDAALQAALYQLDSLQQRLATAEDELQAKAGELLEVQQKSRSLEKGLDDLLLSHESEGILKAEKMQLVREVQRLMEMLGSTKEYSEFVQKSKASGGVTYVPPPRAKSAKTTANWVPTEALRIAKSYEGSPDWATQLVRDLHALYQSREDQLLDQLKRKYQTQLADLRRQLAMRAPCDAVYAQKHIASLKSALKRTKTQAKEVAEKLGAGQVLDLDSAVEKTLEMARNVQQENLELIKENLALKRRLNEPGWEMSERRTICAALNGVIGAQVSEDVREELLVTPTQDCLEKNVAEFASSLTESREPTATIYPD